MIFQIKAHIAHNIMIAFMLRNFCILLLFFVVFINIAMFPNYTLKRDNRLLIYSTSTIVYAQQQQSLQAAVIPATNNSQEWTPITIFISFHLLWSPECSIIII
jgi:hypothetical protein